MPPRFLHPFLPYRSLVLPILVVSAVAVPCWLLFRLYRRRTSEHDVPLHREILLLLLVAYLSGLAAVTLGTNRNSRAAVEATEGIELRPSAASLTCATASMPEGSRARGFCVRNARGNFLLFLPLGVLLPLVRRGLRFRSGVQIALAVSIGIELLQYLSRAWGSKRLADVNDVILNVAGACLGLAVVTLLRSAPPTRHARQHHG